MDPNTTWAEICSLLNEEKAGDFDAEAVIDLVDALEQWLGKGGFMPEKAEHVGRTGLLRMLDAIRDWIGALVRMDIVEG